MPILFELSMLQTEILTVLSNGHGSVQQRSLRMLDSLNTSLAQLGTSVTQPTVLNRTKINRINGCAARPTIRQSAPTGGMRVAIYWSRRADMTTGPFTIPRAQIYKKGQPYVVVGANPDGYYDKDHTLICVISSDLCLFDEEMHSGCTESRLYTTLQYPKWYSRSCDRSHAEELPSSHRK